MGGITKLTEDEVREVSKLLYNQHADAINNIQFQSEPERAKYLNHCKAGHDSTISSLDTVSDLKRKYENDKTRSPIVHDIFEYAVDGFSLGFQQIQSYNAQLNYLNKIREHVDTLRDVLDELNTENVEEVSKLAKAAYHYRISMSEYHTKCDDFVSRNFSKWLHASKTKFRDLVIRYQEELNFEGAFEDLNDVQKLEVYDKIIEASGRGGVVTTELKRAFAYGGKLVFFLAAALMVWDIYTSEHKVETAARDAAITAASIGAGYVMDVVLGVMEVALIGFEVSTVLIVGIVTSFVGAFIITAAAEMLFDWFFKSGGGAKTEGKVPFSTDGHSCYVSPLPDGQVTARQVAHRKIQPN